MTNRLVNPKNCRISTLSLAKIQKGETMGLIDKLLKNVKTFPEEIRKNYIVFDVETTGLDRRNDRIIEFALIEMSSQGEVKRWNTLLNPQGPVAKTEIHGITDNDVVDAPTFKEAAQAIVEMISGKTLIAHNAIFDLAFLRSEMNRAGWSIPFLSAICTLEASNYYLPDIGRRKLKDCCDAAGIKVNNQHRALGDVEATAKLMEFYLDNRKYPSPRKSDFEKINEGSPSNFRYDPNKVVAQEKARNVFASAKPRLEKSSLRELLSLLESVNLQQYVGLELKPGYSSYLEKLLEFLEDGQINSEELQTLNELASTYTLNQVQINEIHAALVTALALHVQKDESVSVDERSEIKQLCLQLGLKDSDSAEFIKQAKAIKNEQLSESTKPLPANWSLGEPLRVGDRVVFTGCEPTWRTRMEEKTRKAGITVSAGVTKKTKVLITDGSYVGNKANDAKVLGIRVVSQDEYEKLLEFRQAAVN